MLISVIVGVCLFVVAGGFASYSLFAADRGHRVTAILSVCMSILCTLAFIAVPFVFVI